MPAVDDRTSAATALYGLALDFQERSQQAEAGLIEQFENAASSLMGRVGIVVVVDDLDEHLELALQGFRGRVIPEGATDWTNLDRPEEIVRFYDPTDIFGDLADAIADAFPGVAEDDLEDADEDEDEGDHKGDHDHTGDHDHDDHAGDHDQHDHEGHDHAGDHDKAGDHEGDHKA